MVMDQTEDLSGKTGWIGLRRRSWLTAALVVLTASSLAACTGNSPQTTSTSGSNTPTGLNVAALSNTTPPASGAIGTLDWDLFYEPTSVDPAHALDSTENEVVSNLCDALVRETPDFSLHPGLASYSNPSPTTWVYEIHPGVKFWDGTPLTATDVAYSLNRNLDPKVGSYWSSAFQNVASITATGSLEVTVKLSRPDELFNQNMALAAGAISEKQFDEVHGKNVGTPSVGVMCSGPYKFVSWAPGNDLTVVKNGDYWDSSIQAKVSKIVFSFVGTDAVQTNALTTGSLEGMYETPISGTKSLQSSAGKLYFGKSLTQYMIQCITQSDKPNDPINNVDVRQALSLAINRGQVAKTIFNGTAAPPVSKAMFANADTYTYGQTEFAAAAKTLPSLDQNITQAKQLVTKAGNPTTPIIVAYASDGPSYNGQFAQYLQSAANVVGLNIKLDPMTTAQFNNIGFDPKLTSQVDISLAYWFETVPDPVSWYQLFTPSSTGSLSVFNYGKYQNATVTKAIQDAVGTTNLNQRTADVITAQKQLMTDLPWIPVVDLPNRLYMGKGISGAPASAVQSWYPWATEIGATP